MCTCTIVYCIRHRTQYALLSTIMVYNIERLLSTMYDACVHLLHTTYAPLLTILASACSSIITHMYYKY